MASSSRIHSCVEKKIQVPKMSVLYLRGCIWESTALVSPEQILNAFKRGISACLTYTIEDFKYSCFYHHCPISPIRIYDKN